MRRNRGGGEEGECRKAAALGLQLNPWVGCNAVQYTTPNFAKLALSHVPNIKVALNSNLSLRLIMNTLIQLNIRYHIGIDLNIYRLVRPCLSKSS